jgi:NRAMP (natural resistance-associated macrophage protein)-like metal ion transporter
MLKRWRIRILLFLAVLGPGFITANIDNDSGGILTYSNAGAQFGYTLLWTMIPITIALLVVQEMCARMGAVTGKGLSDLIREEFGLRMTFLLMLLLVIVNFGNVMAEFVGIAGSMQLFHVSKYISVPVSAFAIWFLVVKGDYKRVEKVFLAASVFYIAYIVTGVLSQPSWHDAIVGFHMALQKLHLHDCGRNRHHYLSLDAVLFTILDCREGGHGKELSGFAS